MDILEMINGDGYAHGTYHWETVYPQQKCAQPKGHVQVSSRAPVADWSSSFHEYALERSSTHIAFVYDGVTVLNVSSGNASQPKLWPVPFYLILNTAIGGPWPGPTSPSTVFPTYHVIDYVKVVTELL